MTTTHRLHRVAEMLDKSFGTMLPQQELPEAMFDTNQQQHHTLADAIAQLTAYLFEERDTAHREVSQHPSKRESITRRRLPAHQEPEVAPDPMPRNVNATVRPFPKQMDPPETPVR